jgi:DNA-directed RNA polymerase specialized sigma24 family protein
MRNYPRIRGCFPMRRSSPDTRDALADLEEPGAFQCLMLRALELPQAYRDVFLLKDVQGHPITEIAARLGITVEAAWARLKRARREIDSLSNSGPVGRAK